jgi:D-alanine-D-alanine ligase
MKVAVVFDSLHPEWEDEDYRKDIAEHKTEEAEYDVARALADHDHDVRFVGIKDDVRQMLDRLAAFEPDMVFNCSESFRGNSHLDYTVAGVLEMHGYRFTGSPATGLLVARNKSMSKKILAFHGIRVADFAVFHQGEGLVRPSALRYPLIVKPLMEDASLGIAQSSVVSDDEGLGERITFIHEKFSQAAIAEELIEGRELYVGMLGNDPVEMLPVIEMDFGKLGDTAERRIATWKAKWDDDYRKQQEIRTVFARKLSPELVEKLKVVCETAFHALGFCDYARLDLRLTHDDEVYVLEANPNPFIAREHEMAMAAEKAGMKFGDFIERILQEARKRYA